MHGRLNVYCVINSCALNFIPVICSNVLFFLFKLISVRQTRAFLPTLVPETSRSGVLSGKAGAWPDTRVRGCAEAEGSPRGSRGGRPAGSQAPR